MIVLLGGEKGGTGKTMLATHLAVWAADRGFTVKLVDADAQGSSERWARLRAENRTQPFIPWSVLTQGIYFAVIEEARHYQMVIVDTSGADSEEFESALAAADVLISPVVPSDVDVITLKLVEKLVAREVSKGRALRAYVALNHCSPHTADDEADAMRASIADYCKVMRLAMTGVHTRKPFRTAYRDRLTVQERVASDPRAYAKAAAEIMQLLAEIFEEASE